MATPRERPNTALLVVDMQNAVLARAHRRDDVIANIDALVGRARAEGVPVIWVQHSSDDLTVNSPGWQYVPELQRRESEPLVHKLYGDSFEDTALEPELVRLGVGRLIVTGAQTDACIRATIHGAFTRGYDTVLVSDAHTTEDLSGYGAPPPDKVIAHTNLYWAFQTAPGRKASVVGAAAVRFAANPGRNTMSENPLPDIASMLVEVISSVPEASRPRLLALLERTAAGRYEGWAKELPLHAPELLACAARENEIAATAEKIFPLDAGGREKLEAPLQSTREAYFAALAPLSIRDQFRLQAIAERAGGGAWRAMAAALGDAKARAALERSGDLEEANAAALDVLVAKLRA